MNPQISEEIDSKNSISHKKTPKSEQVWKWITTATAAILLSACAAPQRNPDVIVIQDSQYNSGPSSVYQRERVLNRALNDTHKERELLDEQRRLEEQRARNRQKEYSDQVRLQQKTRQFEAEQGRKITESNPQISWTPPAPRKPVSIYPDNHPHWNNRY